MYEYKSEDFETYSRCFDREATRMVELMRILDEKIQTELDMHSVRPKDLFRMVMDLSYGADAEYKKEKNIEDTPFNITTFVSKDELSSQMRVLLRDELQRYFGGNEGDAE